MSMGKVLIVEDDRELRRGLTLRLKNAGYDVVLAEDGAGAVSTARMERPDAILLDIGLPGGDGITVLERYAGFPDLSCVPVVVLTGRDPRATEPAVRRFGVSAFLRKPADNATLLATISSAIRGGAQAPAASSPDTSDWLG